MTVEDAIHHEREACAASLEAKASELQAHIDAKCYDGYDEAKEWKLKRDTLRQAAEWIRNRTVTA